MSTSRIIPCDYLLLVATPTEEAQLKLAWKRYRSTTKMPSFKDSKSGQKFYDLGDFNRGKIYATRSQMGSDTPKGSSITTTMSVYSVNPTSIIMIGLAFAFSPRIQPIGTVIISEGIWGYDYKKVDTCSECGGKKFEFRSKAAPASKKLVSYLSHFGISQGLPIQTGWLLSGQTLINNLSYRDFLRSYSPNTLSIIGGEMEGAGFYSACKMFSIDWVVVKAVCDYADGNKNDNKVRNQRIATQNAVEFILSALDN